MIEWLNQLDFIVRALIVGILIALVAGPLGSVMVWRKMAYFGEMLAHATLLGASISFWFQIHLYIGLLLTCLMVCVLYTYLSRQRGIANDALLGLLAHALLAVGLIVATQLPNTRIDMMSFLFGDILAVDAIDMMWVFAVLALNFITLYFLWGPLVDVTLHEELAAVEGVSVAKTQWQYLLLMAAVFAVSMKLIGVLLITALLIIPASAARQISRSPEQMAVMASGMGALSVFLGIMASKQWDWPTGPSIVVASTALFLLIFFLPKNLVKA